MRYLSGCIEQLGCERWSINLNIAERRDTGAGRRVVGDGNGEFPEEV